MSSDEPVGTWDGTERRAARRQRALKESRILFSNGGAIDCTVRNISDLGAMLRVEQTVVVPEEFELLLAEEKRIIPARMVWRSDRELGVAFTGQWRPV